MYIKSDFPHFESRANFGAKPGKIEKKTNCAVREEFLRSVAENA